jgi:hypothetical protein
MRTLKLYKSYSFRDKDPIIDAFRTLKDDSDTSATRIAEVGPSTSTIHKWLKGKTRRPQFAAVWAAARACGATGIAVDRSGHPYFISREGRIKRLRLVAGAKK